MAFCSKCGNEITDPSGKCLHCEPVTVVNNKPAGEAEKDQTNTFSCKQCGAEIAAGTTVCLNCGCKTELVEPVAKTGKRVKKIWIILGAVVLVLGILAAVLFVPRDLRMDDFKKTNVVSAVLKYGLPESIDSDEDSGVYLRYGNKVDFYGITPYFCTVYTEEDKVVFSFADDDGYEVIEKLNRYCDFEENISTSMFYDFSYDDLEITASSDGSYVSIEIY